MAIGVVYEGDGFIRHGPAIEAKPVKRPEVRAQAAVEAGGESLQDLENRARALRRQYLNEMLCWLLER